MRILMMIHRLADNSPYCFYVHEQAKALREQGHDVTVISCVGTMPMMKRLRPALAQTDKRTPKADVIDGIPVYFPRCLTLGNAGEKLLGGYPMYRAALPIARKLHDEKPFDVIHAHMLPREGHAGRLLGRALGVPVALTVHGTDVFHYFIPGQTPWKRNIETAQNVDALMAVSSLLLSRVAPYRGEGKISRVVQNGVDLSLVPENEARRPRSVISVGTLKARKCMDKTLEAFARLADEYEDATLTIVGIGEMEAQLKARIAELRLQESVTLTGGLPHEEVLRRMAQSDLFVLPSWGEGYGIVYIEAMAAGCIAVGAENEGIADTITDGENGFLVPAADTDAVEAVMRAVFAHPEAYEALRARGTRDARSPRIEINIFLLQRSGFSAACTRIRHEIRHSREQAFRLGFFDFLQIIRRCRLSGYARVALWCRDSNAGVHINVGAEKGIVQNLPDHRLSIIDDLLRVAARGEALQEDDNLVAGDVCDILIAESVHGSIFRRSVPAYGVRRQARFALFPPVIGDGLESPAVVCGIVRVFLQFADIVVTLLLDFFVGLPVEIFSLAIDGVR